MILDKREQIEVDPAKQAEFALGILNYNQNLIQFADSKANALLLINSIFIAAIGPFIDPVRKAMQGAGGVILVVFFITSVVSLVLAMNVIMTRKVPEIESKVKTLIFYNHITESPSPEGYIHEFMHTDVRKFRDTTLSNAYVVASIARSKFGVYNYGQIMTLLSCMLWLLCMFLAFLG